MPYVEITRGRPEFACVGCRNGYYWGEPRTTRRVLFPCAYIEIRSLNVEDVAATYEGDAQSRAEALSALTDWQRSVLYPVECACGKNHQINAASLVRAWRAIHPNARQACVGMPIQDYLQLAALRAPNPEGLASVQLAFAASSAFRRAG